MLLLKCLAGNELESEGVRALVPALQCLTSLTSLEMTGNCDSVQGEEYGGSGEAGVPRRWKNMGVWVNCACACGVGSWPKIRLRTAYMWLSKWCMILYLRCLAGEYFGSEGASALVPALQSLPGLTLLDISSELPRAHGRMHRCRV